MYGVCSQVPAGLGEGKVTTQGHIRCLTITAERTKIQCFSSKSMQGGGEKGLQKTQSHGKQKAGKEKNKDHAQELRATGSPPTLTDFLWLCR